MTGPGLITAGLTVETANERPLTPELLCAQYAQAVYRFAALVAKGEVEAEDLAQEALVRAIRNLHTFDPRRGTLRAWLWRIVVNAASDAGRVAIRRRILWGRIGSDRAPAESAEDLALERLSAADLIGAVRRLGARERGLIALRFGAGLTFDEVGSAIGVSEAAATMATRRALDKLRILLEGAR